ncbi:MAG: hypothetical protein K2O40_03285 [Lachnospiraceae bacterium]|nr:hypothetical protein [Lachnospiraceae bacterium]
MKKRSGRKSQKKERAIMIASSVLVLSALTVTGVYVRNGKGEEQDGGYTIDFSSLEDGRSSGIVGEDIPVTDSDLDYDPASTEVDSSTVQNNYGKSTQASDSGDPFDEKAEAIRLKEVSSELILGEGKTKDGMEDDITAFY